MGRRICILGDSDFRFSGYYNIITNIALGLVRCGHEIKIVGVNYHGEYHDFPFSILPAKDYGEANAVLHNLAILWHPDVVITAADIPLQQQFVGSFSQSGLKTQTGFKHVGITALENDPLVMDWAMVLSQLDYVFFISELGKQAALKTGLTNVDHLQIGIDFSIWGPLTDKDRKRARKNLGYNDDDFIVITVADNQERKNLWASLMAIKHLIDTYPGARHILVTREHNPYGWKLRSLVNDLGLNSHVFIYERGMPNQQLNLLYGISDVFLLLSKAEGLGMPILEAMACDLPCVCTDTGAMHELLDGGRGELVPSEYEIPLDTWGNSRRSFADPLAAKWAIVKIGDGNFDKKQMRKYIKTRTWDVPVNSLHSVIESFYANKQ